MSSAVGTLFSPVEGVADTGTEQSRIFTSKPHVDGLIMAPPALLSQSGPNALALTRSAAGLWTLNRTAAGAETYYFRTTLDKVLRLGEFQQYGGFGSDKQSSVSNPKGIGIIDAFAIFQVGVVALTSGTLRIGKTVYSATIAPVQTDLVAATALTSVAVSNPANPLVQTLAVPGANQVFSTDDFGLVEVELSVVMASTGTFALAGMGFHVALNYN